MPNAKRPRDEPPMSRKKARPLDTSSRKEGSYQWWKDNYARDPRYQKVRDALSRAGFDVSATEIDHFPPKSIYKSLDHPEYSAREMPAFPLIRELHQYKKGEGDSGGVASSSKNSQQASEYRDLLSSKKQLADVPGEYDPFAKENDPLPDGGDYYRSMRRDIMDKRALAPVASPDLFDPLLRIGVDYAFRRGLLNEDEHAAIYSGLET